jgi:acetolactate synthase-1/2/3 large subunit
MRWLASAERPLILAGLGILHHGAHAELAALARRAGAAVITTYKAKGVMAEDDPLVIGGAGLSPVADRALFKALHAADLILCLGYDPVEMRDSWIQPWDARTDSAEIGWAPVEHGVHRAKLEFVADLGRRWAGWRPRSPIARGAPGSTGCRAPCAARSKPRCARPTP